ncbi:hypothetical protein LEP1GSC058_3203 [Leptospira fainei serovar Hurstbridge str. BUT 6]|uniref:Uncharacterized protein n=1 Tax=Leptospira fainei serovar Hurstbridge str. BUT 6 TaxID=1193011 RepID=S3VDH8_9LEPT|nr:hypothetical protein LEP1GSC058_3203 [Leptospira fainei serovar Hurstbridge str. BUT 6]
MPGTRKFPVEGLELGGSDLFLLVKTLDLTPYIPLIFITGYF